MKYAGVRSSRWVRVVCALALLTGLVGVMVSVPVGSAAAAGTTYWVDAVQGSDSNDGTSTAQPFKTITKALSYSNAGGTVMIKPGVYDAANGETFPLVANGESLTSTDGTATTVIDGDDSSGLLSVNGPVDSVEIRGITFRDAATTNAVQVIGSGSPAAGYPRIIGNHFEDNAFTGGFGGAMMLFSSGPGQMTPVIESNVFEGNTAVSGGALYLSTYTSALVRRNTFADNAAESGGAVRTIAGNGATHQFVDNLFQGNSASVSGGALDLGLSGAVGLVEANRFFDNAAAANGGAIQITGGGCEVTRNDAGGNVAGSYGGFGLIQSAEVTSTNNAIGGGSATSGAGWCVLSGRFRGCNDTIVSSQSGPAVLALAAADAELGNCILWNEGVDDVLGFDLVSYSDIHDADVASKNVTVGAGVFSADPVWAADPSEHKPDIASTSPCIDAGSNALAPAIDFYGVVRPIDGDYDGTATADVGCCEVKQATTLTFSAPSTCDYAAAKLSGTLKNGGGAALVGLPVKIEYSYDGFAHVAGSKTVNTVTGGKYSWTFAPTKKAQYRAQFRGDTSRLASTRITRTVLPKVYLTNPYAKSTQTYGKSYTFRGYLKPKHTAGSKQIRIKAYRYSGGKYRYKKTYYAKAYDYDGYTKYSVKIELPRTGRWRLKAYHPADSLNAATYSGYKYVRVR